MYKWILVLLFSLSLHPVFSQSSGEERNVRNGIGFIPSKADGINGLAFGWFVTLGAMERDSIVINGLYSNVAPLQLLLGIAALPFLILSPFAKADTAIFADNTRREFGNRINGVSISIVETSDKYAINGLQISGLFHNMYKLHGISISGIASGYYSFHGIMVSGLFNGTQEGKGLQIGLVNKTRKLKGVQIGLWNKIGKRGLPFINMSFKKKDEGTKIPKGF